MASGVNASLRTYIVERMAVYDSSIDTAAGSDFDQIVIVPLLNRLGPDTTETDAEQIIIDRIRSHDSAISTEVGSGIRDGLITPLGSILEPFRRAVNLVLLRGSWSNVESLTEEEADILAENSFYYRDVGYKSYGSIRLKFASPRDVSVTLENVAYAGNLRFVPTHPQQISRLEMTAQTAGPYYYMDVTLVSQKAGSEYNVTANSITKIDGITGVVGVTQLADFTEGRDRQTNLELREAAKKSIVVRNLLTERSILTVLPDADHYPSIGALLVVGRMDPAMTRDLVYGAASIGGIPQGIKGTLAPDIVQGGKFHMGGFTDIWVSPAATTTDVVESIDIKNLYNKGALVTGSTTGVVNIGNLYRLEDIRGFFSEVDGGFLPVLADDIVLIEGKYTSGRHDEFVVGTVGDKYLDLTTEVASLTSLSDLSYEVRRKSTEYLEISLDGLVAEDSDGAALLNSSGDPYLPVPGPSKESEGVISTSNKGTSNVSLPLFYIDKIEFLNPVTNQPTGVVVPEADPIAIYISDRVSDDLVLVRVVYRYPTRFMTERNHYLFTLDTSTYYAPLVLSGLASAVGSVVTITGVSDLDPYTDKYASRKPRAGDLLTAYNSAAPDNAISQAMIISTNTGSDHEAYTLESAITFVGCDSARITQGTQKSQMTAVDDFGFSYFEFIAEMQSGTRQPVGTTLASPTGSLNAQGWRLFPRLEGYSFSTLEEPILRITNLVNDTTPMESESIRITYSTTPLLQEIQTFLDQDTERVPAEDLLVRRMPPARVHVAITFQPDTVQGTPSVNDVIGGLSEYIQDSVGSTLASYGSATALSNVVEDLGAERVTYPFSTIVEYAGKVRSGSGSFGQLMSFHGYDGFIVPDGVAASIVNLYRMAHFIPGSIKATEDT